MTTIKQPRPAWDQSDYESAVENLEREIQGLAVALRERGVSFPERPATAKGGHDVVAQFEALTFYAAQLRVRLSMASKPATAPAAGASKPIGKPTVSAAQAGTLQMPKSTLTARCLAAAEARKSKPNQ